MVAGATSGLYPNQSSPLPTQIKPKQESGEQAELSFSKDGVKQEAEVQVLNNGYVALNGRFYKSSAEVASREAELKQRISKYQQGLEVLSARKKSRPAHLTDLKTKKDSLLRMGIPEDSKRVQDITNEMKSLSEQNRKHTAKEQTFRAGIQKTRAKLEQFINNEMPYLLKVLRAREEQNKQQQLAAQRRKEAVRVKQQHELIERRRALETERDRLLANGTPGTGLGYALNRLQNYITGRVETDHMRLIRELREREEQRVAALQNPTMLNAYNTDDLKHLLESVKRQEEEEDVEGEANTPDELMVSLLRHQRIGLKWLEDAEDDKKKRGGILADAMGLGKTLQMIALMVSHRADKNEEDEAKDYGKTNLIVTPVSLMKQWQGEFETRVKSSAGIRILMYHSMSARKFTWDQMKEFDVVLVSYGTLSSELGKHCKIPGLDDDELKLKSPPNLIKINQMKTENDYVSPFFSNDSKFYRIVLDEAQQIKNKSTKVSISAASLKGFYKWCLSGTPMQNNINELYPLLRFVGIRPYNDEGRFRAEISSRLDHNNKNYDEWDRDDAIKKLRLLLRSIMLRREKDSKIDGKPILELPEKNIVVTHTDLQSNKNEETFYNSIEQRSTAQVEKILRNGPIAKGDYSYIFVLLLRLRQACLHSELVRIGDRKKGVVYDDDGNVIAMANIDSMCSNAKKLKPEVVRRINSEEEVSCPICLEELTDEQRVLFYPCGHSICKDCLDTYFEKFQDGGDQNVRVAACTACRLQVKENAVIEYDVFDKHVNKHQPLEMLRIVHDEKVKKQRDISEKLNSLNIDDLEYSSKIASTIELLKKIWEKTPDDKVIIFSNFTSFFFILSKFLKRAGIDPLQYLGSMNANARDDVVREFYRDDNKKLMLISLKAGNAGLTLTCANHVIIMDPFWNPYVEYQAQDRCHRIGQQKPVTVYRMLIKNTVEDRILDLQERKRSLIESALDPSGMKEASRLSREDIARLFNINL
ncbi:CYFA0S36e00122g1_1 [Cyberlindnera fabianii]|uniref:CYFA0S36e00122g1_1 n=1 Tax=Cyberlindnera fabianii TaxID=36022 RepID=A0A061BKU6_CYBFA|nr:CYFA0S36e00122g1_1 [Cyberlindnera fabianii]